MFIEYQIVKFSHASGVLCPLNHIPLPPNAMRPIWRWFTEQRNFSGIRVRFPCQDERKRHTTFNIEFFFKLTFL